MLVNSGFARAQMVPAYLPTSLTLRSDGILHLVDVVVFLYREIQLLTDKSSLVVNQLEPPKIRELVLGLVSTGTGTT